MVGDCHEKILVTLLFSCLALFCLPISVNADTNNNLVIKFNELTFTSGL